MATHVSIEDIAPRIAFAGDGAQKAFPFPYPLLAEGDVEVYVNAVRWLAGFTVAIDGDGIGGTVTFAAAPAAAASVVLVRARPYRRTTDFQPAGDFRADVINDELDSLEMQIQQLRDRLGRTLTLAEGDPATAALGPLPNVANRAGRYLSFDGQGQPIAADIVGGVPVTPYMVGLLDDVSAAAALSTLGLTAFARSLVDDADAAAARTTLGLGAAAVMAVQPVGDGRLIKEDGDGSWLWGMVVQPSPPPAISNNATDPDNDIDFAKANCTADDAGKTSLFSSAGFTKRLDVAWAAGAGNGGLDTGTKQPNTWYSVWVIAGASRIQDGLFSTSATAPAMPAGYTFKRRVGWVRTDAIGNILPFVQRGDLFLWETAAADATAVNIPSGGGDVNATRSAISPAPEGRCAPLARPAAIMAPTGRSRFVHHVADTGNMVLRGDRRLGATPPAVPIAPPTAAPRSFKCGSRTH